MRGLELLDLDSCTGCSAFVHGALSRYRGMELAKPFRVVIGGDEQPGQLDPPPAGGELLVVGDCAKHLRHAGTFIPGCPVKAEDLHAYFRDRGLACQRCHPALRQVLSEIEGEPLHASLRAVCGGEMVHRGPNNQLRPTDLALLVGNCTEHYYRNSRMRADQVLGGIGDNVAFVPGCPPTVEDVRAGLAQLRTVAARRAGG
jgi:hypothetical protein